MKSVFSKYVMAVVVVVGLAASSCGNNERSREVKVKQNNDGSEDVRVRERKNTDSVDYRHDKTIKRDGNGGDTRVKENTKVDKDNSGDDNNRTRR